MSFENGADDVLWQFSRGDVIANSHFITTSRYDLLQPVVRQKGAIGSRRHTESGQHRQASLRHFGQTQALATYEAYVVFAHLVKPQNKAPVSAICRSMINQ